MRFCVMRACYKIYFSWLTKPATLFGQSLTYVSSEKRRLEKSKNLWAVAHLCRTLRCFRFSVEDFNGRKAKHWKRRRQRWIDRREILANFPPSFACISRAKAVGSPKQQIRSRRICLLFNKNGRLQFPFLLFEAESVALHCFGKRETVGWFLFTSENDLLHSGRKVIVL